MTREEKYERWKLRMAEYEASGETIEQWTSKQEGITSYQFHYWRNKFKNEGKQKTTFMDNPQWTSIDVPEVLTSTSIELTFNEFTMYIPESVSEEHVARVIRVLRMS